MAHKYRGDIEDLIVPSRLPHVHRVEIKVRTDVLDGLEGRPERIFGATVTRRSTAGGVLCRTYHLGFRLL